MKILQQTSKPMVDFIFLLKINNSQVYENITNGTIQWKITKHSTASKVCRNVTPWCMINLHITVKTWHTCISVTYCLTDLVLQFLHT